jgi:hypothetical protein
LASHIVAVRLEEGAALRERRVASTHEDRIRQHAADRHPGRMQLAQELDPPHVLGPIAAMAAPGA